MHLYCIQVWRLHASGPSLCMEVRLWQLSLLSRWHYTAGVQSPRIIAMQPNCKGGSVSYSLVGSRMSELFPVLLVCHTYPQSTDPVTLSNSPPYTAASVWSPYSECSCSTGDVVSVVWTRSAAEGQVIEHQAECFTNYISLNCDLFNAIPETPSLKLCLFQVFAKSLIKYLGNCPL